MKRIRCAVAALALGAATASAQDAPIAPPGAPINSVERIRKALEAPPPVTLLPRTADFSVHIEAKPPMHEIFEVVPWATPPVGWQPPAIGFNLLGVVQYVAKEIGDAKRQHDLRVAREEVQRAMTDFCAAQPDGGATVKGCAR